MNSFFKLIAKFSIKTYQYLLSPWFGANCRYHPTCSQYALECFEHFPWWKATFLSSKRILRCHPWAEGGHDPIPHIHSANCSHHSKLRPSTDDQE